MSQKKKVFLRDPRNVLKLKEKRRRRTKKSKKEPYACQCNEFFDTMEEAGHRGIRKFQKCKCKNWAIDMDMKFFDSDDD